jgi:hypothetical protein
MSRPPLRVLHLEDNRDYSALVGSKLAAEGLAAELLCVDKRADFESALDRGDYDLIIADYSLPDYDGVQAMKYARQKTPDTPILLVSGTIGEEAAIESLRAGATDYVLKQWPERLVPAVRRALREAAERKSRLQAETALERREKLFLALSENTLDVVAVLDQHGTILYLSSSAGRMFGFAPEELIGASAFASIHEEDRPAAQRELEHCIATPATTTTSKFRLRHKDGSWRHVETICQSRLADPAIGGVVVNLRDMTEHWRLEEQLRQSQKMEAVGQLAGGVAHDFNNILTVIQGHASLLRNGPALAETQLLSVEQIYRAAERAAGLTRQLLTFSRRQIMQFKPLDLNAVLGNLTLMLGRLLGEDIALQFNYAPGEPWAQADVGMIEQIIVNLAVNARDAMPKGGRLTISVSVLELGPEDLPKHPDGRAGRFVCLTISDTGSGIAPEVLPRIFEPFFTTKPVGKGTGLGLATVYGIVKQHDGWVAAESQVGQGTTFRVFLPALARTPQTGPAAPEETAAGGTETILVVEDEFLLRELMTTVLTTLGYRVIEAASGVKALEIWQQHKHDIDLVLTDIIMPEGMTGRDLVERIHQEKPELKAIYTSGYSSDIVGKSFLLQEGVNYLQKPFVPQKLARTVRQCLDAK